ncbi:hypothetical protein FPOA_10926 [Fusarium poae]|uniref:Uncharacterized protein n=1 Tax=Fusarium poae TaxID=36050 RepID=A0A1B8AFE1_FUSPO|nr:hypothetical protein FPOA_10926 [Fusarium poae]
MTCDSTYFTRCCLVRSVGLGSRLAEQQKKKNKEESVDHVEETHQDDIHVLDPMLNAPCFGCKNKRQRTPQAFQVTTEPPCSQRRCCIIVGRAGAWRSSQLRSLADAT